MSLSAVQRVIGMLITDEEFRRYFEQQRADCLANLSDQGIDLDAIEVAALMEGEADLWSQMATHVDSQLRKVRETARRRTNAVFTRREQAVLRGVFEGLSNKEIAARDGVSENAVKATIQQLFRKTHVRSRAQLVRVAMERSLGNLHKRR